MANGKPGRPRVAPRPRETWQRRAKLTPETVIEIRSQASKGVKQYLIAASFGISQANVNKIVQGKSWKNIDVATLSEMSEGTSVSALHLRDAL